MTFEANWKSNPMPFDLLIVDDSAAIRKILQRVLQKAEAPIGNVYEAGDGVEALAVMRAKNVNLVLSDINMPNMDGLQLLPQIRANEEWKTIPVILITTEGSQAKVMEAAHMGATGYVRKPFTPEQINHVLAGLVGSPVGA